MIGLISILELKNRLKFDEIIIFLTNIISQNGEFEHLDQNSSSSSINSISSISSINQKRREKIGQKLEFLLFNIQFQLEKYSVN